MGRGLVSELLELLFGARSFSDLEHVEAHSFSEGLSLTHCDNVANIDIPEAGGQVHRHGLVAFLETVIFLDVEVILADDNGPLNLHSGHHTIENVPLDGDITRKGAFLVNGILIPDHWLCSIVRASTCKFLQAGSSSYFDRLLAVFVMHVNCECLPSSSPPKDSTFNNKINICIW